MNNNNCGQVSTDLNYCWRSYPIDTQMALHYKELRQSITDRF